MLSSTEGQGRGKLLVLVGVFLSFPMMFLFGVEVSPMWFSPTVKHVFARLDGATGAAAAGAAQIEVSSQGETPGDVMLPGMRAKAKQQQRFATQSPKLRGVQRRFEEETPEQVWDHILHAKKAKKKEKLRLAKEGRRSFLVYAQCVFAAVYYYFIVKNYRFLEKEPKDHRVLEVMEDNVFVSLRHVGLLNMLAAFWCQPARSGHTFEKTRACGSYWTGCISILCCPQCALLYTQNRVRKSLGATPLGCFANLLSSCCCSCCVIAQQAEALDVATRQAVECGGVVRAHDIDLEEERLIPPVQAHLEERVPFVGKPAGSRD